MARAPDDTQRTRTNSSRVVEMVRGQHRYDLVPEKGDPENKAMQMPAHSHSDKAKKKKKAKKRETIHHPSRLLAGRQTYRG